MTSNLLAALPPQTSRLLEGIPALIDKTFPLPARFRSALPKDIAELSRLLTSGRGERSLSYMGRPALLSAYLRFFLPWNLYRLCRLLPGLDIQLTANDGNPHRFCITDLGCGPLTFATALWISRPDLRSLPIEFQCLDRSGPVLDAGKKIFAALTGDNCPWKIRTIKVDVGTAKLQAAALVSAVNVFNEMHGDISRSSTDSLKRNAAKDARQLAALGSAILVVEPGFPRCGTFISLLRGELINQGYLPSSPCLHDKDCPFPGAHPLANSRIHKGKGRWCHFAFETDDAPAALHRLSQAAGLPKERAMLSFIFSKKAETGQSVPALRIISDAFPLPQNSYGRYCCSPQGLVLLTGDKNTVEQAASGTVANVVIKKDQKDPKSGALLAEISSVTQS
jgi:ribosomal protein RSM22 (predicted rRNA methylase)